MSGTGGTRRPLVRRIIRGILRLIVWSGPAFAAAFAPPATASPERAAEANRLYDDGDYEAAAAIWGGLLAEDGAGLDRGALEYNLGNAEFRAGRLGRAMLHWERTLLHRPGDRDALANLELSRRLLDGRLRQAAAAGESDAFARELLGAMQGFAAALRRIPARRFAVAVSASALVAGGFVTLLLLGRGGRRRVAAGLALALLAAAGSGTLLWRRLAVPPAAVVVEPGAALRSGPGASFPRLASLPEGFYLELGEDGPASEDGFRRVVAAGIVGYADRESVVPIRAAGE